MSTRACKLSAACLICLLFHLEHGQAINTFDLVMGNHLKGLTKTNSLQASASGKAQKAGAVPFTNTENTYYRGPEVLITKEGLHTPGECLSLCLVDTRCEFWTHCPAKSADGCGVVEFSTVERDVTTRTMHPGTCILSRSTKRGQKELLTMEGEDVLWSGGYYSPGGFVETPSSSSASSLDAPLTPALPGDCPEHKPPTNWRLRASHDTIKWPVGINLAGHSADCYDIGKDDFVISPTSQATCQAPAANPGKAVEALAQQLCDGTSGSGSSVDVTEAQATFFYAIQAGGQEAVDGVAALMFAQSQLKCWEGSAILDVLSPPVDKMVGPTFEAGIVNIVQYYTDVANAAEYAGMGMCAVFYSMEKGKDSTKDVVATVRTGRSGAGDASKLAKR